MVNRTVHAWSMVAISLSAALALTACSESNLYSPQQYRLESQQSETLG